MNATATAPKLVTVPTAALVDKLRNVVVDLSSSNPERQQVIAAIVCALVARQHVLLLGEPGTGKSRLANLLSRIVDARGFRYLMTRFTEPAELFGSTNIKILAEEGRQVLVTKGRLVEAEIGFLDEIFKSSSAILNSLLTLLNEGEYFDDGAWKKAPLRFMIAASNEVPEEGDRSVEALYDRILVRLKVEALADDANLFAMLNGELPDVTEKLASVADLDAAHDEAMKLPLSRAALLAISKIRRDVRAAGILVSDRRWNQAAAFLRAHAWLMGLTEVNHGAVSQLTSCLWSREDDADKVNEIVKKHAPSWEAEIHVVSKVVAEQRAALSRVDAAATKAQAMEVVGGIQTVLDEKVADLDALAAKAPESSEAVELQKKAIADLSDKVVKKSIEVQTAKKAPK